MPSKESKRGWRLTAPLLLHSSPALLFLFLHSLSPGWLLPFSSPKTHQRMYISHVVASGFLLALLALGLEAMPAPQNLLQKGHSGRTAALGRELAELLASAASGPAAGTARSGGGGTKQGSGGSSSSQQQQQQQQQQRAKGSASSSSSRLMRDLRTDTKQARAGWARGMNPEHHAGGGGGGGGSRRFKGLSKKGLPKGCFGLKLDRIGSMSGLGC